MAGKPVDARPARAAAPSDAALYWLAKMLHAGEDIRFIARRLVIAASEDIGLADSRGLLVAVAAQQACEFVGLSEAQIPLAHATVYLATAPKSNSTVVAIDAALAEIRKGRTLPVPPHLRDAHYAGAERLGHGQGYLYPHDFPGHIVAQDYLGAQLSFYQPSDQGRERQIRERLNAWCKLLEPSQPGHDQPQP